MSKQKLLLFSATLMASASISSAQSRPFENSWFWGVKGGVNTFSSAGNGGSSAPTYGLDWVITRAQGGLYVSADQSFFKLDVRSPDASAAGGTRGVAINDLRRFSIGGLIFPVRYRALRPYAGAGYSIALLGSARPRPDSLGGSAGSTFIKATEDARSRASLMFMGGVQLEAKRGAFFAQETILPSSSDFLLSGNLSFFEVGFRYNVGSSIDRNR